MVIDVDTSSNGMSLNKCSISSSIDIGTPTLPTSPLAIAWSESYPICVGKSKAIDSPITPFSSNFRKRWFDSSLEVKPAYWRMVQDLSLYISL